MVDNDRAAQRQKAVIDRSKGNRQNQLNAIRGVKSVPAQPGRKQKTIAKTAAAAAALRKAPSAAALVAARARARIRPGAAAPVVAPRIRVSISNHLSTSATGVPLRGAPRGARGAAAGIAQHNSMQLAAAMRIAGVPAIKRSGPRGGAGRNRAIGRGGGRAPQFAAQPMRQQLVMPFPVQQPRLPAPRGMNRNAGRGGNGGRGGRGGRGGNGGRGNGRRVLIDNRFSKIQKGGRGNRR
eukprot:TRINITY_DN4833_c0_g1_i2.p1 TRINITY_DN4833_c0_g1~~TRINITY_DN4833_c0_g1_i2.p1  ORF type:complete len:277 (+),score=49.27 TRINITY_DN4833_c0_g1_i2:120-833(+)